MRNKEAVDQTLLSDEARLRRFGPYVDLEGKPVTANAVEAPGLEEANFIRFRELAITYNLSSSLSARLTRSQRASIVFGGRNIGLWTKYTGSDPETISDNTSIGNQFSTTEFFNFPPSRRFFFRLNLASRISQMRAFAIPLDPSWITSIALLANAGCGDFLKVENPTHRQCRGRQRGR